MLSMVGQCPNRRRLKSLHQPVTVAVVTALLVAALVWSEARYFLSPGYSFKFTPDADYEAKLTINVDLTVAMPCDRK